MLLLSSLRSRRASQRPLTTLASRSGGEMPTRGRSRVTTRGRLLVVPDEPDATGSKTQLRAGRRPPAPPRPTTGSVIAQPPPLAHPGAIRQAVFGPADSDIQAVTAGLQTHGFRVALVSKGRTVIEFSGTAAVVQEALHTAIHKYVVAGELIE